MNRKTRRRRKKDGWRAHIANPWLRLAVAFGLALLALAFGLSAALSVLLQEAWVGRGVQVRVELADQPIRFWFIFVLRVTLLGTLGTLAVRAVISALRELDEGEKA